jgi:hypothetical protein
MIEEVDEKNLQLCKAVKALLPENIGFIIVMTPFHSPGSPVDVVSCIHPEDTIRLLRVASEQLEDKICENN